MGVRIQVNCDFCVTTEGFGRRTMSDTLAVLLQPRVEEGWRVDSSPDGELIGMACPDCVRRMADLPSE